MSVLRCRVIWSRAQWDGLPLATLDTDLQKVAAGEGWRLSLAASEPMGAVTSTMQLFAEASRRDAYR